MTTSDSSSASPAGSRFDVSRTLTFFFEDPNWVQKLLVGSLFAFLSPAFVGAIFMTGFALALARHTMDGNSPSLPEWDDLPALLIDGLKGMGISLAHKLPVIALGVVFVLALLGGVFLQREGTRVPEDFLLYGLPALFAGWIVVFALSVAILVYVPAAFVNYIRTDRFGAAFEVMNNIEFIRNNIDIYIPALLAIVLAAFIAQFGFLLFCIGIFPAAFWSICVMGYVVGELARLSGGRGPMEGA